MNRLYDALEYCLQAIEDGADINSVLARFPDLADELRPILEASVTAREMTVPEPSADAVRRGRAKLLQRAGELREAKAPARRRMIPVFQRLALALTLATVFLASGTGLVRASSSALPGENLYSVKRTWEGLRLLFVFDQNLREALESEYEDERLEEVSELLAEGRYETIQFAGVLMDLNGSLYVSGIRVVVVPSTQLPADALQNGAAVIVTGHTNAEGFVEAEAIAILPPGTIVPVGNPVEVEDEEDSGSSGSNSGTGSGSSSENESGSSSGPSEVRNFRMEGIVQSISDGAFVVNGQAVFLGSAELGGTLAIGVEVEVEGYYGADGRFIATKVNVENHDSNENGNSGSNSNEGNDDNSNSDSGKEDNSNDERHEEEENKDEDHSGSGGGGGDDNGDD